MTAETYVPHAPTTEFEHVGLVGAHPEYGYGGYQHFKFSNAVLQEELPSIMISSAVRYEKFPDEKPLEYYATNTYCDQFNTFINNYDTGKSGSSIYFDFFIRIPYVNISKAMPLKFSVRDFGNKSETVLTGHDNWGYPIYEYISYPPTCCLIEMVAPSKEYDRYMKSAYQHMSFGDTDPPIFNQVVPIKSNIKNGLGIFAGYSSVTFKVEIERDEE